MSKLIVVKIGTSSLTDERGVIDHLTIDRVAVQVAQLRRAGHRVVVVSSGAVASGLEALGIGRADDILTKQAVSAVGQSRLMRVWDDAFARSGHISGQVLLTPNDFFDRSQYLHARETLARLLELGVIPIINENDAIADDEIRFGDNDRIAALVAHLLGADLLVLLTDTAGLFTGDPRMDGSATLIERIDVVTASIESMTGGAGTSRGSGGMASKLRAAKIASWSGVQAVIAAAVRPDVLRDAVAGTPGVGTVVLAQQRRLGARKLWIAFAVDANGAIAVDDGARQALTDRGVSLLPAGVRAVSGNFGPGDAVDITDSAGCVFARGLSRHSAASLEATRGRRTAELPPGTPHEVVHRDDLVILP